MFTVIDPVTVVLENVTVSRPPAISMSIDVMPVFEPPPKLKEVPVLPVSELLIFVPAKNLDDGSAVSVRANLMNDDGIVTTSPVRVNVPPAPLAISIVSTARYLQIVEGKVLLQ